MLRIAQLGAPRGKRFEDYLVRSSWAHAGSGQRSFRAVRFFQAYHVTLAKKQAAPAQIQRGWAALCGLQVHPSRQLPHLPTRNCAVEANPGPRKLWTEGFAYSCRRKRDAGEGSFGTRKTAVVPPINLSRQGAATSVRATPLASLSRYGITLAPINFDGIAQIALAKNDWEDHPCKARLGPCCLIGGQFFAFSGRLGPQPDCLTVGRCILPKRAPAPSKPPR